jgi:hypothetical protein
MTKQDTLPPLPDHPEPQTHRWSALEIIVINRYGKACFEAGNQSQAQDLPDGYALVKVRDNKHRRQLIGDAIFSEALAAQAPQPLDSIEQYRMQMAAISTAALGYWKEGDGLHPDYDTVALRDVASLYARYNELYQTAHAPQQAQGVATDSVQVDRRDLFDAVRAAYVAGGTTDDADVAALWGDATDYANRNTVVQAMLAAAPQAAPAGALCIGCITKENE